MPSCHLLEQLVGFLRRGRVPKELRDQQREPPFRLRLQAPVAQSEFRLMRLVVKVALAQNGTAWLRVERTNLLPAVAMALY